MAAVFRNDLLAAGVDRPALHNATPTRKAITFHDLRATACTWAAIRGDSELQIRGRSGHETLSVLTDYVRDAEAIKDGFGSVFPALPKCLLGASEERPRSVPSVPATPTVVAKFERDTGFERVSIGATCEFPAEAREADPPAADATHQSGAAKYAERRPVDVAIDSTNADAWARAHALASALAGLLRAGVVGPCMPLALELEELTRKERGPVATVVELPRRR